MRSAPPKLVRAFSRHAHVGLHGHAHADLADGQAEAGAHDEGDSAAQTHPQLERARIHIREALGGFQRRRHNVDAEEEQDGADDDKGQNRAQLPAQIGVGAGADGIPHFAHGRRAGVLRQHLAAQVERIEQAQDRNPQHAP
jgi:hypothetical protein